MTNTLVTESAQSRRTRAILWVCLAFVLTCAGLALAGVYPNPPTWMVLAFVLITNHAIGATHTFRGRPGWATSFHPILAGLSMDHWHLASFLSYWPICGLALWYLVPHTIPGALYVAAILVLNKALWTLNKDSAGKNWPWVVTRLLRRLAGR